MSEVVSPTEHPGNIASAGHYMSYLWYGHCINHPEDYRDDVSDFHQDEHYVDQAFTWFKEKQAQDPQATLIRQLQRVIKSAMHEVEVDLPLDGKKKRLLQVHLIGETSVRGMEMAHSTRLIKDYPDLAVITSPFIDGRLTDGLIRSAKIGRISSSFSRYATTERLLPGYLATISQE